MTDINVNKSMSKKFLAFQQEVNRLQNEAGLPSAANNLEAHNLQSVSFARRNMSLSLEDAHARLSNGELPPVFKDARLNDLLSLWEDSDKAMDMIWSKLKNENADLPTKRLFDIARKYKGDENELILSRIYDVFEDMGIPIHIKKSMTRTMSDDVVSGKLSPQEAYECLDHPRSLLLQAKSYEAAHDFQRRQTLVDLSSTRNFLPTASLKRRDLATHNAPERIERLAHEAYPGFKSFAYDYLISELAEKTSAALHQMYKNKSFISFWTMLPLSVIGGVIVRETAVAIAGYNGYSSSLMAFALGTASFCAGAVLSVAAANPVINRVTKTNDKWLMLFDSGTISHYIQEPLPGVVPENVRIAFKDLSEITQRLVQPKNRKRKAVAALFRAVSIAVTAAAIIGGPIWGHRLKERIHPPVPQRDVREAPTKPSYAPAPQPNDTRLKI